jgi:hypothetical protein
MRTAIGALRAGALGFALVALTGVATAQANVSPQEQVERLKQEGTG